MRVAYICADPSIPVVGTKGTSVHVQEVIKGMLHTRLGCHSICSTFR
ncbi:Uncharacterised protein [Aggregatibacter aphrophilus]|uniref:Uncharacterized protein n=2 Tax=Aggregatibacter aphrophilus TaxID=732 RepID=A0A336N4D7_AGGAP|nr:hypothetical protein HMPREF9335_00853 [Aggregatibacter aphrophilus F0387]SQI96954.1 Uncharacterised protein [Aggregatibacter aphrophilus]SSY93756.1 Uncharacterised protein [Aggregatibacter aphrophilus]VEF44825.1 Uncharacterised protein [Aggregatibacter aphrophilus ATCC 33389]